MFRVINCTRSMNPRFKETNKKVQVGKDQENAQSEKDSHTKNRGGKKPKAGMEWEFLSDCTIS